METPAPIGIEPGVQASGKLPIPCAILLNRRTCKVETAALETANSDTVSAETAAIKCGGRKSDQLGTCKCSAAGAQSLAHQQNAARRKLRLKWLRWCKGDASNEETATTGPVGVPVQRPQLAKRTISLDRYSAPQENSTSLGKFALASNITIREFSDVRAPAYGRNVIREVPKIILVQGFNLQPFGPGKNNFQGKAVTAMKFALQRSTRTGQPPAQCLSP